MKKFAFRLQTVLEMREKKLEDKRREMAVIIKKLNDQKQAMEELTSRRELAKNSLENIYEGNEELDILRIQNYKDYIAKTITDEKNQQKILETIEKALKAKQNEVTAALKEVKIFEKLKETQEKKFYQHYEYVQAKEIDDITSTRYGKVLI